MPTLCTSQFDETLTFFHAECHTCTMDKSSIWISAYTYRIYVIDDGNIFTLVQLLSIVRNITIFMYSYHNEDKCFDCIRMNALTDHYKLVTHHNSVRDIGILGSFPCNSMIMCGLICSVIQKFKSFTFWPDMVEDRCQVRNVVQPFCANRTQPYSLLWRKEVSYYRIFSN